MNIVTGGTMAEIDRVAIEERKIPSLHLMERAGIAVAGELHRLCANPATPVLALCGRGNNGGDGFVAARRLQGFGYRPRVLLSHPPEELSPDSRVNWKRFDSTPFPDWEVWRPAETSRWFESRPVVVDALLGTGATGAPRPPYDDLIRTANRLSRWVMGVDIPSGVDSATGEACGAAMKCRATVTFGLPKSGHFLKDGLDLTGSLSVADIGFPHDLLESAESQAGLVTVDWAAGVLPRFTISTHKGQRGRVLLIAGSPNLMGAGILCAKAAVATGSGLVTLALPRPLNGVVKAAVPEAMTLPLPATSSGRLSAEGLEELLSFAEGMDAVALGPGLGEDPDTCILVREFVEKCGKPLVLDADGINNLGGKKAGSSLGSRNSPTVLTPHPGELARFVGAPLGQIEGERWKFAQAAADDFAVTLVLKGAVTVIASPQRKLLVNRSGHPAMAQGGMGDALTGIVASLLGQGLAPQIAAALGVYLHGRAGEHAARAENPFTISASQLIRHLSQALSELLALASGRHWARPFKPDRSERGT